MFADTPTRIKIDLAGQWQYTLNGKEWDVVSVPSAYDFVAKITFQRNFEITPEMIDKFTFFIVPYGINYLSEISINGNFIGRHMGGYTSFVLPIPFNIIQSGKNNAIKISVDNELTPKTTIPLRQQVGGWRTYGGIFRDIYILATPKLLIENPDVKSELSGDRKYAKVKIQAYVTDRGSHIKIEQGNLLGFQFEIYDKLTGNLSARSGLVPFTYQSNRSIPINTEAILLSPKLWTPETPDMYVIKFQIVKITGKETAVIDEYNLDTSIRDIHWSGGLLEVNNTPVTLKGLLWNEENSTFGSAMTYEALERDIALIKTLGANLLRFQYPPHPYILNLCDRYGLFVMEEIPLIDVPEEILSKDYFQDLAATYSKEMVNRDKSHVSVLAWGIGNELEASNPSVCEFVNTMRNIVKALDGRPVYIVSGTIKHPCFENVDIIAFNNYQTDFKKLRELLRQCKNNYTEKPIVIARYGIEVEPENRNGYSDSKSMEYQAYYAMRTYEAIKEAKIAGSIFGTFNDWRSDRPALSAYSNDPYLRTMGLVSYEHEKRTVFDVIRALYNDEKVQALPIGNYASSTPIIYVVIGFIILISFAFLYNINRRFREAVNRSFFRTYNFFADIRDQRILKYSHSLFLALIVSITWAVILSSILSHYRENIFLDNILSQFLPDKLKEILVVLVWHPLNFILFFTALIFIKLLILTLIIRLFAFTIRTHVYFYHAFSITMWSMLPYIILIPLAMIIFRLLESDLFIFPIFVIMVFISLWVLLRLLKGVSIIYDVMPFKLYIIGFLLIIASTAILYAYYDYSKSTSLYLKYLMTTIKNSI